MIKIIAEIGVNHNGSLEKAKELALVAKNSGCDYVKLQKRTISLCYSKEWLDRDCRSPWGTTVRDKVEGRELSWDQLEVFDEYCKRIGIEWSMSCFDIESFKEFTNRFVGAPFYKVPSGLVESPGYVITVARMKELTLISTGLLSKLKELVNIFENYSCPYVLNHCAALYPPTPSEFNLKYFLTLSQYLASSLCKGIGYSSHENGIISSLLSIAYGTAWIEQHITLDKTSYGADQKFSLEPDEVVNWVRSIRIAEAMCGGTSDKLFTGAEKRPVRLPEEIGK